MAPARSRLGTITAPTTVAVGELDVPCFHAMAQVLASEIPGARKVMLPDAVSRIATGPTSAGLDEHGEPSQ
jgi:pimeloyl-ACP methyl ester carboxylesterase